MGNCAGGKYKGADNGMPRQGSAGAMDNMLITGAGGKALNNK